MQDKQNKGIGQYKDRPGYFMGGMIGGAILGALVNKIQGKDWKRGALWGGISGGLGSWAAKSFMPAGVAKAGSPKLMAGWGKLPWYQKMLATAGSKVGVPAAVGGTGALFGLGVSQVAGDPKKDLSDYEDWVAEQEAKRREKQKAAYKYWHWNPWATGGIVSARKGFYNGGGAWSDVAGEEEILGSGQDKIMSITGQSGLEGQQGLEDITETFEMSELSDEEKGELQSLMMIRLITPKEDPKHEQIEIRIQELLGRMSAAEGGYKTRPQYAGGGMTDDEKKAYQGLLDSGYTEDEAVKIIELHGSDYGGLQVPEFLKSQAGKAEGGIADLDMTGGGASFGPGTGTSDDIPAMLSDGEFVVTAKAVENLGGGDRMLGARKMYQMMNQLDPASQTPTEMSTVGIA
jgi:hypothetical protein